MKWITTYTAACAIVAMLLQSNQADCQDKLAIKSLPETTVPPNKSTVLPKMADYGSTKCIPCKAMAPILEELREEYKGRVEVIFIDVTKYRKEALAAEIRLIPTQVFFDANGKEVGRHEGFLAKDKILDAWREHKMLPVEPK